MRIIATGVVRLAEADDLTRFAVEDADAATLDGRLGAAGAGRFDGEHAWIRPEWIAAATPRADTRWHAGFDRMLDYAARQGWTGPNGEIRAHVTALAGESGR